MEIYCNHKALLEKACEYSKKLNIDDSDAIIHIYKLPPSFRQKAIIEHQKPELYNKPRLKIYGKFDSERYISLAHEMVHAKQIIRGQEIDENEAYMLENTLDNDH